MRKNLENLIKGFKQKGQRQFKQVLVKTSKDNNTKKDIPTFVIPYPQSHQGSSWTFHKPARIKCSLRSLQTSGRSVQREAQCALIQVAQPVRNTTSKRYSADPEPVENRSMTRGRVQLTVKWWTPQGSSNSFSKDTAQLSTLFAGPDSPPGVPGRLELLPPQPRVDMFSSAARPGNKHTHLSETKHWLTARLNWEIFTRNTHSRTDMLEWLEMLAVRAYLRLTLPGSVWREKNKRGDWYAYKYYDILPRVICNNIYILKLYWN